MRSHHHGSTSSQSLLDRWNRSAYARIFGDFAAIVLWYVQIGANKYAFSLKLMGGNEVTESIK